LSDNLTSTILKRIISFFAFLIVLTSCNSEFKPATFETVDVDVAYEAQISATYSRAKGTSTLSKTINSNVENAIIEALSSAENTNELKDVLKAFNTEYLNFKNEFSEESEPAWELQIETELTYQSEEVITIAVSTYEFKGGAHGSDQIQFLNLDAKTGKVLNQDAIIKDIESFKTLAENHFIKSLETKEDNLKIEDFFFGEPFHLPENIGFSEDGLVLLYNVYEVASYDQGYTEFVIPFSECESYLKVH
tara:strand:+ start:7487 stop:8233 length:747 start_codon:yes stop_codon:yes gene_type:complete